MSVYLQVVILLCSLLNVAQSWQIRVLKSTPPSKGQPGETELGPTGNRLNLIYPGTKWCGSGNIADDYNDLGSSQTTDRCCREHDTCHDVIEAGETAHGLTNNGLFTKLHCSCDQKFLDCLKSDSSSKSSYFIGVIYFNGLDTKCFREEHPIIQCAVYYPLTKRCKEYEVNTSKARLYQFFDVPLY